MSILTKASMQSMFPSFLLPSIPFRRRQSNPDSTSPSSVQSPDSAVKKSVKYLSGHTSYLRCARCAADLCLTSQIISKGFTGRHGRAYLVSASTTAGDTTAKDASSLLNTHILKAMPRQLVTGAHTVSDISCAFCGSVLGWKYVAAEEESQRYKVGKFILETKKTSSSSFWEHEEVSEQLAGRGSDLAVWPMQLDEQLGAQATEGNIVFDSQDEDECEDLFAGVWSPALATKRRQGKKFAKRLIISE